MYAVTYLLVQFDGWYRTWCHGICVITTFNLFEHLPLFPVAESFLQEGLRKRNVRSSVCQMSNGFVKYIRELKTQAVILETDRRVERALFNIKTSLKYSNTRSLFFTNDSFNSEMSILKLLEIIANNKKYFLMLMWIFLQRMFAMIVPLYSPHSASKLNLPWQYTEEHLGEMQFTT